MTKEKKAKSVPKSKKNKDIANNSGSVYGQRAGVPCISQAKMLWLMMWLSTAVGVCLFN